MLCSFCNKRADAKLKQWSDKHNDYLEVSCTNCKGVYYSRMSPILEGEE